MRNAASIGGFHNDSATDAGAAIEQLSNPSPCERELAYHTAGVGVSRGGVLTGRFSPSGESSAVVRSVLNRTSTWKISLNQPGPPRFNMSPDPRSLSHCRCPLTPPRDSYTNSRRSLPKAPAAQSAPDASHTHCLSKGCACACADCDDVMSSQNFCIPPTTCREMEGAHSVVHFLPRAYAGASVTLSRGSIAVMCK